MSSGWKNMKVGESICSCAAEQDGKESRLVPARRAVFAPGYLLFVRGRTLVAQPFDAVRGQMTGEAFPVAEGVSATTNGSY